MCLYQGYRKLKDTVLNYHTRHTIQKYKILFHTVGDLDKLFLSVALVLETRFAMIHNVHAPANYRMKSDTQTSLTSKLLKSRMVNYCSCFSFNGYKDLGDLNVCYALN